ncbi:DUF3859 domain-containing protein [Lentimonas sp. CC4]|uniref:DUF3859 domain-containing protein n=2 Tax=Lentimonas TaxID=417293 RepID=UPI001323A359|nr:DUF3859 domain-containing protein [Lentimonas sp. CC4]CAA6684178.1 Unannotated [Lentimonas sp. CC6]CAA7170386.1 Unannotated [Lentimonas sp. CC21]CAA7182841.1 Unannotated [Lentimonas sp. CC8]CAA6679082.1 Unannotated [Lentimonas sp. CC4]CAA7076449.1 Unannotated [Lentimonas sp. CC4]
MLHSSTRLIAFICTSLILSYASFAEGVRSSLLLMSLDRSTTPEQKTFTSIGKADKVPLIIDHGFTVKFTLSGQYQDLQSVQLRVQHPEMKEPNGTRYSMVDRQEATRLIDGKRMVICAYLFEEPWELVSGKWKVQIFDGETLLDSVEIETAEAHITNIQPLLNPRYNQLAEAESLSPDDLSWIGKQIEYSPLDQCIGVALLFRQYPTAFDEPLCDYFKIDKTAPTQTLSEDEANRTVNEIIERYHSRTPLEISTRVYLHFKNSHQIFTRSDGTVLYLEQIFRTSVFTGTLQLSDSELITLSTYIDRDQ